jgi:hypothetical protein
VVSVNSPVLSISGLKSATIMTSVVFGSRSCGLLSGAAIVGFAAAIFFGVGSASAGVAGSSTIGITTEELKIVAVGWSAKKKILGKAVYNDNKQKIGVVDDLIIAPDRSVTYAIIGVGGFVGVGKHDVAIPA